MEFGTMRHFTKEEQKKYTESTGKLYKPTGASIMAEEKARKEAKLEDSDLIKEVMNSDMNDDVKVEVIKQLAQRREQIYVPYVQSPANWWENRPTYVTSPTTGGKGEGK